MEESELGYGRHESFASPCVDHTRMVELAWGEDPVAIKDSEICISAAKQVLLAVQAMSKNPIRIRKKIPNSC